MLIKSKKGFISLELLLSICFLIVMVFFSYQMLTRQRETIIQANQEVEATGYLYEIKDILSRQCTFNFKGLSLSERTNQIKHVKELIEYEDGSSLEAKRFSRDEKVIKGSKTGLGIASYTLSPHSLKREVTAGKGYFIVRFDRGPEKRKLIKHFPVFVELKEGAISKCSLSPFTRELGLWLEKDNLLSVDKAVGFGVQKLTASINVHEGGLYIEKGTSQCLGKIDSGAVFWDTSTKKWFLCTHLGLEPLEDKIEVKLW